MHHDDYSATLSAILYAYAPVSRNSVEQILEACAFESLPKQAVLFQEKKFNGFEYFQLSGTAHRFNADESGQPITSGLYTGRTVITPHFARSPNSLCIFSVQALTDCSYLKIPAGTFRDMMDHQLDVRLFGRRVVEMEFSQHLQFEVMFRSFAARDRLLFFRKQYPGLENQIPHSVIASYLGITPVSFSRLRSALAKG